VDCERALTERASRRPTLVRSLLVLCGILVLAWPAFAAYGFWRDTWPGLLASLAALAIAGIAAGASLAVTVTSQRLGQPIGGILSGMVLRMLVPFLALLAVPSLGPSALASGVQEMLLGYYLVALAAETWLLVQLTRALAAPVAKAA
jgi:hypothetical protein